MLIPALYSFEPSPPLEPFVYDESPLVAVRACNGAGKSYGVVAKVARYAIDNPGSRQRVIGPSRRQVMKTTGLYLYTMLRGFLDVRSKFRSGTGWNLDSTVVLSNGSEIDLKAYTDPIDTFEGVHGYDRIVLDEVPPQAVYWACKGRARQLILTFTVQSKVPPDWLRREIEGDEHSPSEGRHEHGTGWVQYVVPLLRGNVPFYTDEEYEQKAGKYRGTDEEQRRVWAAWESATEDRVMSAWSDRFVLTAAEIRARFADQSGRLQVEAMRYGIDWGEGAGKQCQYLIAYVGGRFVVLHEWIGGGNTHPREYALAFRDAVTSWIAPWPMGLYLFAKPGWAVYGDINSAGALGGGASLNVIFEREVLALANEHHRMEELPFTVRIPSKRDYDKDVREVACNHAMMEGRWFTHDQCQRAIRAYKQYEGSPKDPLKDPIDAQLYCTQDLLVLRRTGHGARVRRG